MEDQSRNWPSVPIGANGGIPALLRRANFLDEELTLARRKKPKKWLASLPKSVYGPTAKAN
jgi:hypothetical protein